MIGLRKATIYLDINQKFIIFREYFLIMELSTKIFSILKNISKKRNTQLHEPSFFGNEKKYLNECINSTFVASNGKFNDRLEKKLKEYVNSKNVILVNSGTSALHISLIIMGVRPGDEVILPTMTFVATANSIKYCGAIPHFVDSENDTLGIDPFALKQWLKKIVIKKGKYSYNKLTNNKISSIIPMHTFGHPCKIEEIVSIASEYNLKIIEDSAESLGSFFKKKHTGTYGNIGIISFNGNKTITSGGGGAILTNNNAIANAARHLSTTAKIKHEWDFIHDKVGYNYRMANINAAIGLAQMENIDKIIKSKRRLFDVYERAFSNIDEIELFREPKNCKSNYWLQTIILKKKYSREKKNILKITNDNKIMTRPVWKLLHTLKPFKKCPKSPLVNSISLEKRIINIPSSYGLS